MKKTFPIDDPLATLVEVVMNLDTIVVEVPWVSNVFGRYNNVLLYFHMSDLLELAYGDQKINIIVMQL